VAGGRGGLLTVDQPRQRPTEELVLREEPDRADAVGGGPVPRVGVGGDQDDARRRRQGHEPAGQPEPVTVGQTDVDEHRPRAVLDDARHGVGDGAGLDDLVPPAVQDARGEATEAGRPGARRNAHAALVTAVR
jgi:hypothetical protein